LPFIARGRTKRFSTLNDASRLIENELRDSAFSGIAHVSRAPATVIILDLRELDSIKTNRDAGGEVHPRIHRSTASAIFVAPTALRILIAIIASAVRIVLTSECAAASAAAKPA
jgi:hypothetical protein